MSLHKTKILGISITTDSRKTILEELEKYLEKKLKGQSSKVKKTIKPFIIVTPNPEQMVLARENSQFQDFINRADVALPDGIGVVLAAQLFKSQIPNLNDQTIRERITGVGFMEDLVRMASEKGLPIALIGGRADLAVKAFECLQAKYPGLAGWAEDAPEMEVSSKELVLRIKEKTKQDSSLPLNTQYSGRNTPDKYFERLAQRIIAGRARLVFVGLGAPKQEYFIEKLVHYNLQSPIVLMSVGGAFDEISGRLPTAPGLIDRLGFKWLWRLVLEPWRWRRQLALLQFVWLVFRDMLSQRSS